MPSKKCFTGLFPSRNIWGGHHRPAIEKRAAIEKRTISGPPPKNRPLSANQQNAISVAFGWRANSGPRLSAGWAINGILNYVTYTKKLVPFWIRRYCYYIIIIGPPSKNGPLSAHFWKTGHQRPATEKRATIGPPAKCHFNSILLAGQ